VTATTVLAVIASVVYLGRLLPQPVRTLRTGRVEGVSALAAINGLVADAAWLVYGVVAHVPAIWLVSVPSLALSAWLLYLLRREVSGRDLALGSTWLAVLAGAGAGGLLAPALAGTVVLTCGPAVWEAYRVDRPAGLSAGTWWLALVDAGTWGAYGLALGDRALELYAGVLTVTAVSLLARLRSRRARLAL
jgi:uncharacterized protein with PQ loop repeat